MVDVKTLLPPALIPKEVVVPVSPSVLGMLPDHSCAASCSANCWEELHPPLPWTGTAFQKCMAAAWYSPKSTLCPPFVHPCPTKGFSVNVGQHMAHRPVTHGMSYSHAQPAFIPEVTSLRPTPQGVV